MVLRGIPALSALTAIFFSTLTGCVAPGNDDSAGSNAAIIGGQSSSGYQGIGYVSLLFSKPSGALVISNVLCTGSLIAPDVVLTAAHCLTQAETQGKANAQRYGLTYAGLAFGVGDESDDKVTRVRTSTPHPGYATPSTDDDGRAESVSWEHDLAYLVLEKPVAGVAPLTIRRSTHAASCSYVASGYGATAQAKGDDGTLSESGKGTRKSLDVCADSGYTNRMIASHGASGTICHGDSGGPLRVRNSSEIIGVASYAIGEDCTTGLVNYYAPVATNLDFIDEALSSSSDDASSDDASGDDSSSE